MWLQGCHNAPCIVVLAKLFDLTLQLVMADLTGVPITATISDFTQLSSLNYSKPFLGV